MATKKQPVELVEINRCKSLGKADQVVCQFKRGRVSCRMELQLLGKFGGRYLGTLTSTPPTSWLDVIRRLSVIAFDMKHVVSASQVCPPRVAEMDRRIRAKTQARAGGPKASD